MHFELYGDFKPHSPFGEGWPGAARIGVNGSYELRDLKASYDPPFTLKNINLSAENTQYWDVSD